MDSIWIRENIKLKPHNKQTANSVNQKMNDMSKLHLSNTDSNEVFFHII